jgi:hypothetical protein
MIDFELGSGNIIMKRNGVSCFHEIIGLGIVTMLSK